MNTELKNPNDHNKLKANNLTSVEIFEMEKQMKLKEDERKEQQNKKMTILWRYLFDSSGTIESIV